MFYHMKSYPLMLLRMLELRLTPLSVCLSGGCPLPLRLPASIIRTQSSASDAAAAVYLITAIQEPRLLKATLRLN